LFPGQVYGQNINQKELYKPQSMKSPRRKNQIGMQNAPQNANLNQNLHNVKDCTEFSEKKK
jgi:hypothetical protein